MTTGPRPITRQRSAWVEVPADRLAGLPLEGCRVFARAVHDGALHVIVGVEPIGPDGAHEWHLSISHRPPTARRAPRYPTWDEITDARYSLLPDDRTFALLLPPRGEYVAVHDTTFHLHEVPA